MRATWAPQLAVLVVVLGVLLLRHRRALRGSYAVPRGCRRTTAVLLWLAAVVVLLIGPAILAGVPAWMVALAAAVVLVAGFAVRRARSRCGPARLVRLVPWSVLVFAIVLFAVVEVVVDEGSSVLRTRVRHGRVAGRAGPARRAQHGAGQRDQQPAGVPRGRAVRRVRPTGWSPCSSASTSGRCCWPGARWRTCCGCGPAGRAGCGSRRCGSGSRACSSSRCAVGGRGAGGVARPRLVGACLPS